MLIFVLQEYEPLYQARLLINASPPSSNGLLLLLDVQRKRFVVFALCFFATVV